jgi:hypothetical protein
MARLDTAQLLRNATAISCRAAQVQQDPAVQKAWGAAATDAIVAGKSLAGAIFETRSAWKRSDGGTTLLYA